ncbi:hypothetical protein KP509_37G007400 [Ceratopteris richardii]|uniref:Alginate lyase 2 domain-containing protein n=1 Tax=Ceratopteris richardii TaxID=49495 RepID=A0A8T2Q794_CERRI|nr:hypothetical protein KP509_37G007400 [Ceratopteris richardii]
MDVVTIGDRRREHLEKLEAQMGIGCRRRGKPTILAMTMMMMVVRCSPFWNTVFAQTEPTYGFTKLAFNCEIQEPYNLKAVDRFSFANGVYDMWVLRSDKPFLEGSRTMPRSELRVVGHDYSSGKWQFEGDFYVASNITGICIMQIFGGSPTTATALQIRISKGELLRYGGGSPTRTIAANIYNRWIHLNVIHDADMKYIQIYVDNLLVHEEFNDNYKRHYFKYGAAYTEENASPCLESKWRNVGVWKKSSQVNREVLFHGGTASCFPQ